MHNPRKRAAFVASAMGLIVAAAGVVGPLAGGASAAPGSAMAPWADQGFYGSAGTYTGSWPDRDAFDTGDYTADACWTGGSHCTGEWGPNTFIDLTSDVTGTSVKIN
jgi:hypothetical protein